MDAPSGGELSEHFTEQFLGFVSPAALAQAMTSLAARLREDLILIDADSLRLSAKLGGTGLRVEASVQPEAPLIMRPSTGRTIVVLTNRLFPVLALNAELIRSAT